MGNKRCLFCYGFLEKENIDFHPACSRKFFETKTPPVLPYSENEMLKLGEQVIKSQTTVTGVQPKLSLELSKPSGTSEPQRFTIVGLWGNYILKPPTKEYRNLPELEDVTMHLASLAGIPAVPHSLIRLNSGSLSYITKRIDRTNHHKIHMEDMCQLTERLTEHKYQGSYEQIGKAIIRYSENPVLDIIYFLEQILFSFLTGNADMHLKNFSLIDQPGSGYVLAPAYDMVASNLVVEGDDEDLALTLNGKKKKILRNDFLYVFNRFDLNKKTQENIFAKFRKAIPKWHNFIDISFLPPDMKQQYHDLIIRKSLQIGLIH
ncbi:MAG TPA: type II toxin-antitoxin system HipA family toxin [Bacteroidetes bacterium]|nr:type II toxin-antitoxin system HipA family toxin [Bacteroidota bacterium]